MNSDENLILAVSIIDTGIGMNEEEVRTAFDGKFDRRNGLSRSLNPYGNGIGLQFCKQVC